MRLTIHRISSNRLRCICISGLLPFFPDLFPGISVIISVQFGNVRIFPRTIVPDRLGAVWAVLGRSLGASRGPFGPF